MFYWFVMNIDQALDSVRLYDKISFEKRIKCFLLGHKNTYIFAYADKSNHSVIYLMTYPDFKTIIKLKGSFEIKIKKIVKKISNIKFVS